MGNRPSEMMDREKAYIPELQISFMEHIAMPIYKCVLRVKAAHPLSSGFFKNHQVIGPVFGPFMTSSKHKEFSLKNRC